MENQLAGYQPGPVSNCLIKLSELLALLRGENQQKAQAGMDATQNALRGIPLDYAGRAALLDGAGGLLPTELSAAPRMMNGMLVR